LTRKKKVAKKTRALAVRSGSGAATKRSAKNKKINQVLLRQKIAAGNHHAHILKSIDELDKLDAEVKKIKCMTREDQAKYMTRLGFLKTKIDAQFKLLNKYLPDLRSLEFKESDEGNPFVTAAKAWAEALSK